MRTITAAQQAVLNAGNQAEFCRVQVKDAGGTWRDLTTYPGFNAVKTVQWSEQIDDPHAKFTVTLLREMFQLSLSPYVAASALNHGFNPLSSFAALLAVNRELKIECAVVPMDAAPSSGDWFEVFHGRIETCDPGSDQDIELTGTSMSGRLSRQYIKTERVYSYAADGGHAVALRVWEGNQVYAATDYLLPASRGAAAGTTPADPGFNKFLKNHTAGTSGTTEPVWTTGSSQADGGAAWDYVGAPTTAGNPVEEVMQNILDDNKAASDSSVTLYVPSSPGWDITQFIQQREFTMDAIAALATQIGWDVRDRWRSGTSQFELTFYQPTRSSPTVVQTFGKSDYGTITQLKVDLSLIRNAVRVIYPDAADLWPDGTPKRKVVEVSDSTSIGKFGELWMELQEDQNSQIDSGTEATAYANAALSDGKDPTAELDVPLMRGFPWAELNDFYKFSANGLQFDSDQSLAVTQYQHESTGGKGIRTTLQTRGLPTIGIRRYLRRSVHPKVAPKHLPHALVTFNGPVTPSASITSAVGGHRVELKQSFNRQQLPEEYEHHVYPVTGTPLDGTTLKAVTQDRASEFGDLIPGYTYFHRVVPRYRNGHQLVRGQPSAEASFVAGQASAAHLVDGIALGDYPLNGGFETRRDGVGMPDHWKIGGGTLNTDFTVMEDGNGVSGGRYLRITSSSGFVNSALIPVVADNVEANRHSGLYRLTMWVKPKSTNTTGALEVFLSFVDYAGAFTSAATAFIVDCTTHKGHWLKYEFLFTCDGDSAIRAAQISLQASSIQQLDVDECRVQFIGSPWYEVGPATAFTDAYEAVPDFQNSYANYGAGEPTCAFRRDQNGRVWFKGLAANATTTFVNKVLFTVPPSFCPQDRVHAAVAAGGKYGQLEVASNGDVILTLADSANPSAYISLDQISFVPLIQ